MGREPGWAARLWAELQRRLGAALDRAPQALAAHGAQRARARALRVREREAKREIKAWARRYRVSARVIVKSIKAQGWWVPPSEIRDPIVIPRFRSDLSDPSDPRQQGGSASSDDLDPRGWTHEGFYGTPRW
jgi:glyoxylase-like metal-dependent hydrolase (beta-lactamase superfamily II)